jgi:hypothetical protein
MIRLKKADVVAVDVVLPVVVLPKEEWPVHRNAHLPVNQHRKYHYKFLKSIYVNGYYISTRHQ